MPSDTKKTEEPKTTRKDSPLKATDIPPALPEVDLDVKQPGPPPLGFENEPPVKVDADPYFKSDKVFGLGKETFSKFLWQKDVTWVIFYESVKPNLKQEYYKEEYVKAAEDTVKDNLAYAAVDCIKEESLCRKQKVAFLPFFILFSKGAPVQTYGVDSRSLERFAEICPVLEEYEKPPGLCTK